MQSLNPIISTFLRLNIADPTRPTNSRMVKAQDAALSALSVFRRLTLMPLEEKRKTVVRSFQEHNLLSATEVEMKVGGLMCNCMLFHLIPFACTCLDKYLHDRGEGNFLGITLRRPTSTPGLPYTPCGLAFEQSRR